MYGRSRTVGSHPLKNEINETTYEQAANVVQSSDIIDSQSHNPGIADNPRQQLQGVDYCRFPGDIAPVLDVNESDGRRFQDPALQDRVADLPCRTDVSFDITSSDECAHMKQLHKKPTESPATEVSAKLFSQSVQPQGLEQIQQDPIQSSSAPNQSQQVVQSTATKRSTSQILALLGRGRKAFQPPLKQKPADNQGISPGDSPEPSLVPQEKSATSSNTNRQLHVDDVPFQSQMQEKSRVCSSARPNSCSERMGAMNKKSSSTVHEGSMGLTDGKASYSQERGEQSLGFANTLDDFGQVPPEQCELQGNMHDLERTCYTDETGSRSSEDGTF